MARLHLATPALLLVACHGAPSQPPRPAVGSGPVPMVFVQGGTFLMGALDSDPKARPCERPRHQVTVSDFYLDQHEVTVAAYAAAVAAGHVTAPESEAHLDWHGELATWGQPGLEEHPVNGVNWLQADAYCRALGKRLPTEAEFEYLLRGAHPDALYPWGDEPAPTKGFGNCACSECPPQYAEGHPIQGCDDGFIKTAPVMSFAPDPHGIYDLTGNVWEWCADWYGERYYGAEPVTDPTGPASGRDKILRGGGHHCVIEELRSSERHHKKQGDGAVFSGFRCASGAPVP
ncbi:MAG: SUMF1/EgtB/PvdO family nonheme iron enzyme [Pseudomonadota bacterium]